MAQADQHNIISFPPQARRRRSVKRQRISILTADQLLAKFTDQSADPAFGLIGAKRAADVVHCSAIDVQDDAESRFGDGSTEAWSAAEDCEAAYDAANEIEWKLATTKPTTLAGVAAVLSFANQIEDEGGEWPNTDTIGPEGWHYKLRATMAEAVESIIRAGGGAA
jgi:hypothetical protein